MEELIIKERKTKEALITIINESGLPALILKPILKELLEQIIMLEPQQYEQSRQVVENKKMESDKKGK